MVRQEHKECCILLSSQTLTGQHSTSTLLEKYNRTFFVFRLWEKGIVPFMTDPQFGKDDLSYRRNVINEVIRELEEETCLQFVNMTGKSLRNSPDYL